jgi:hypothetical protein
MSALTVYNRRQDGAWNRLPEHLAAKPYNPSTESSIKSFCWRYDKRGNIRLNTGSLSPELQFPPTLFFQFLLLFPLQFRSSCSQSILFFLLLVFLSPSSLFLISRPISVLLLLLLSSYAIRHVTYVYFLFQTSVVFCMFVYFLLCNSPASELFT